MSVQLDQELKYQTFDNDYLEYRSRVNYFEWNGANIAMLVLLILFFVGFLIIVILFGIQSNSKIYTMPNLTLKDDRDTLENEIIYPNNSLSLLQSKKFEILVIYSYFESEPVRKDNLLFFLKNGYIECENIHFLIVLNGEYTIEIPNSSNISILKRKNIGWDFGAWSDALKIIQNQIKPNYYIFLNDSCRGPFLNVGLKNTDWIYLFCNMINEKVKLAGSTLNCEQSPHIQSYAWVTDAIGLNLLLENKIFDSVDELNVVDLVKNREVKMSQIILKNGYQIKSLMYKYKNIEIWNDPNYLNCNDCKNPTIDWLKYYDTDLNPLEVLFIKSKSSSKNPYLSFYSNII